MVSREFIRIAHRRAAWAKLREFLLDRFIEGDTPAKEEILCEDVPFSHKEVSNDALFEVLDMLQELEQQERLQMAQFEMKRKEPKHVSEKQQAGGQEEQQQDQQSLPGIKQAAAPEGQPD